MTHYKTLVDTTYLGQWDLGEKEATVVIETVRKFKPERRQKKRMPDGTYMPEPVKRLEISFVGKKKKWLAGPVSLKAIASMYGNNIEDWEGKPITIYVDAAVEFGGQTVGGIRVRPTAPKRGTPPTSDPLDEPVDEDKARQLDEAAGRVAGDER